MNMPQKEYFKVIENTYIEENKTFDTVQINHRNGNLPFYTNLKPFFDKICELDERYNYGLDLYVCLYNNLTLYSSDYLQNIYSSYGNSINIYNLTSNEQHRDDYINFNNLLNISYDLYPSIDFYIIEIPIGIYLSEYIFEEMRKNNFSDKISRLDSYFVFKDIKSCDYYKKRWKKHNNSIVKIISKEVYNYFEGDIKHIDDIENHITVYEYRDIANKYWQGELTNDPIIETFFQGTFEMKRL